jgi:hypothetical protein
MTYLANWQYIRKRSFLRNKSSWKDEIHKTTDKISFW